MFHYLSLKDFLFLHSHSHCLLFLFLPFPTSFHISPLRHCNSLSFSIAPIILSCTFSFFIFFALSLISPLTSSYFLTSYFTTVIFFSSSFLLLPFISSHPPSGIFIFLTSLLSFFSLSFSFLIFFFLS